MTRLGSWAVFLCYLFHVTDFHVFLSLSPAMVALGWWLSSVRSMES